MNPFIPIYAFSAFLASLGAATVVVGMHDAAVASGSFGLTALSALLLVMGLVLLVAAFHLVRLTRQSAWTDAFDPPPCKPIVLVAFLLTIITGIYVFFAAIGTSGTQRLVVVVGALALAAVGLLGLRLFGRHVQVTKLRIEAAVALGLIGIVVGAGQFWFQNQYVPSHAGRAVALKVGLIRTGEQSGYDVIRARVDYEGIGGRSVSVIGSAYTLTGSRVVRCHRPATAARVQDVFEGFLVDPQASRFMTDVWEERPTTVLAAGKFVGDGKRLDPNVPSGREFVFFVPRHRFQLLRFRAQLFAIPASVRLSQRTLPEYVNFPGDNELYAFWQVVDDSWLHDLIYGRERWVVLRYELVDPDNKSTPVISTALRATARFPNPTWRETKPSAAQVTRLFAEPQPTDSSEPFADAELSLESITDPSERAPTSCRRGG